MKARGMCILEKDIRKGNMLKDIRKGILGKIEIYVKDIRKCIMVNDIRKDTMVK